MNPKVSIIIPCWNAEMYISDAIESSLGQSYENIEIIVVNDGSTDKSRDVIGMFGDKIRIIDVENGGANRARNIGFKKSSGQYIKFLDADDFLEEDCIEKQVSYLGNIHSKEIVYGGLKEIHENGNISILKYPIVAYERVNLIDLVRKGILISLPLYPRRALLNLGGFDERLKSRQEWNLNIRIFLDGYSFVRQDIHCFYQRHHASPFRITNRAPKPWVEFSNLTSAIEPLRNISDPNVRSVLALKIWSVGRWYILKNPAWAKRFFCLSKEFSSNGYEKIPLGRYGKNLQRFGPYVAEIIERISSRIN
ncbi:glycosyltransferase family 2 protein [Consotaella aegiceratis]|uniref:glycosyltransferase family 2 protein n=1 Tax=Consotaella aegiceratis TaxID=3097961 RepID=UPI002F42EB3C